MHRSSLDIDVYVVQEPTADMNRLCYRFIIIFIIILVATVPQNVINFCSRLSNRLSIDLNLHTGLTSQLAIGLVMINALFRCIIERIQIHTSITYPFYFPRTCFQIFNYIL